MNHFRPDTACFVPGRLVLVALVLVAGSLAGCGNKGDLALPEPPPAAAPADPGTEDSEEARRAGA